MENSRGRFVWYELMTTDLAAARDFYSKVVGWSYQDAQMPGMNYWMFTMGEQPVAGLMDLPDEAKKMGTPPSWIGYVAVEDVDATAATVKAGGGAVYVQPSEIPNVGRFAIVADPYGGAAVALFKAANPEQELPVQPTQPGHVGWHELYTDSLESAFDFYSRIFGWEKKEAMDMGEMGVYQTFGIGDFTFGGMMTKPAMMPVACWGYYFNVGNIDEAVDRVKSNGGQVTMEPTEVPGGGFILQGVDPKGASFAVMGSR